MNPHAGLGGSGGGYFAPPPNFVLGSVTFSRPLDANTAKGLLSELGAKCDPRVEPEYRNCNTGLEFESRVDVSAMLGLPPGSVVGLAVSAKKVDADKGAALDAFRKLIPQASKLRLAVKQVPDKPGVMMFKEWCDRHSVPFVDPVVRPSDGGFVALLQVEGHEFKSDVKQNKQTAKHDVCAGVYNWLRQFPPGYTPRIVAPGQPPASPPHTPPRAAAPPQPAGTSSPGTPSRRPEPEATAASPPSSPASPSSAAAATVASGDDQALRNELRYLHLEHIYDTLRDMRFDYSLFTKLTLEDLNDFELKPGDRKRLTDYVNSANKNIQCKVLRHRRLGHGRYGTVYEGYTEDGLRVALKQPKDQSIATKDRERHILTITRHRNVLHCYGVGRDGNAVFLVSQLLYKDLARFLSEEKHWRWTPSSQLRILKKVAKGMAYLHNRGILHVDLAEEDINHSFEIGRNVLVSADLREIRIADFELAKQLTEGQASYEVNAKEHVPIIRAPEVGSSGQVSKASDVWSFSRLCWEVFTKSSTQSPCIDFFNHPAFADLPDECKHLFDRCQSEQPSGRPPFQEIYEQLKEQQKKMQEQEEQSKMQEEAQHADAESDSEEEEEQHADESDPEREERLRQQYHSLRSQPTTSS